MTGDPTTTFGAATRRVPDAANDVDPHRRPRHQDVDLRRVLLPTGHPENGPARAPGAEVEL